MPQFAANHLAGHRILHTPDSGWFAWKNVSGDGPPPVIENPIYGELRATASVENREIEMALFVRSTNEVDCRTRALISWQSAMKGCPTCQLQEPAYRDALPARYARLFDDTPIPSTYLAATAGNSEERDGRLVVYGLTQAEGTQMCELLRQQIAQKYTGTLRCIPASGL